VDNQINSRSILLCLTVLIAVLGACAPTEDLATLPDEASQPLPDIVDILYLSVGCSVDDLILAITNANNTPTTTTTINLDPGCIYNLKSVDNKGVSGHTGLPEIISPIIINGHGSTIQRNYGGGTADFRIFLINGRGQLTLRDLKLANGLASTSNPQLAPTESGGAIANFGDLTLENTSLTENRAWWSGGAIINYGNMEITGSNFSKNEIIEFNLVGKGAAIYNGARADIRNSTFTENGMILGDAAIFSFEYMFILNSTISANKRGIENEGDLEVFYSTIAFQNGYGILSFSQSVGLGNSIVAHNQDGDCIFSGGLNFDSVGVNIDSDGTCPSALTGEPEDISLQNLGDYGGNTLTHALQKYSTAADAAIGNCPATDQRGKTRPIGGACDVGAFEAFFDPNDQNSQSQLASPASTSEQSAAYEMPQFDAAVFYYGGSCAPSQIITEIIVPDPDANSVVMFHRLRGMENGERTNWEAVAMNPGSDGYWRLTLSSSSIPDRDMFQTAYFQVQIVGTKPEGVEVLRTEVVANQIMLLACDEEPAVEEDDEEGDGEAPPNEPEDENSSTQCSDGIDNDGDGKIDYYDGDAIVSPGDLQCSSFADDDEAN
jgi:hypothetical protein